MKNPGSGSPAHTQNLANPSSALPEGWGCPSFFGNSMVLQRGPGSRIWGWAPPGSAAVLGFQGCSLAIHADSTGRWGVEFPPLEAGGPFDLTLDGRVLCTDILVGDVWICSGQSNMERTIQAGADWPPDQPDLPPDNRVRQLTIPTCYSFEGPRDDTPPAPWTVAEGPALRQFSAVAWHFAHTLRQAHPEIPQGLILNAVGGSPAEAWLGTDALEAFPYALAEYRSCQVPGYLESVLDAEAAASRKWWTQVETAEPQDQASLARLSRPEDASRPWRPTHIPGFWEDQGLRYHTGPVWYKKTFTLPPEAAGAGARLYLGTLVDSDNTFLNTVHVGSTGYQYPSRRYPVAPGILQAGENTLVVRLTSPLAHGGFVPDKPYRLDWSRPGVPGGSPDGTMTPGGSLDLTGEWQMAPGIPMPVLPPQTFFQYKAGGLFNAKLAPLAGLGLTGVLWYQGESNTGRPHNYRELMEALVADWRRVLDRDLPFFQVQLPLFEAPSPGVEESGWATLRDQQRQAAAIEHSALVVSLDLGEWNDLHPSDKSGIGRRLAQAALALVYGTTIGKSRSALPWGSPLPRSVHRDTSHPAHRSGAGPDSKASWTWRIEFDHGSDLRTRDGQAPGHLFASRDGRIWNPVSASIEAGCLVLHLASPGPWKLRYGWAANPLGANLENAQGLPASPFELDLE